MDETSAPGTTFRAVPILRIFDEAKAREFYIGYLGFTITVEHRPANTPLYLIIEKDGLMLHLSEHHGDACPGSTVFVESKGLRDYHATLAAKAYRYMRPGLEHAPWNALVMEVTDPFGNRLRFSEPFGS